MYCQILVFHFFFFSASQIKNPIAINPHRDPKNQNRLAIKIRRIKYPPIKTISQRRILVDVSISFMLVIDYSSSSVSDDLPNAFRNSPKKSEKAAFLAWFNPISTLFIPNTNPEKINLFS